MKIFLSQREFWNQVKRERERERERESWRKKERMELPGMFWMRENEGEKENKRRGVEIVDTCVEEKNKKKNRNETYGWKWNEERKNNIKNKKS